jgi:putative DNA-invertase from lambdoid prophage Rac
MTPKSKKVEHQHRNMWHETKPAQRAAIYARVSTEDQHCEIQLEDLGGRAQREGWEPTVLMEKQSTRKQRPVLDQLIKDACERKYDAILVWKLDRFGRTFQELVNNITAIDRAGVRFICTTQSIDTDQRNPVTRLTVHILAAVADFERDLRKERCDAGFEAYRKAYAAGTVGKQRHSRSKKDLPVGRPRRIFNRDRALQMRKEGQSVRQIARALGVSHGTIQRVVANGPG